MEEPKKIDKENLEKALGEGDKKRVVMSKEMEIGFHQGSLNTLINERNEVIKMVRQIEKVMQLHIKRLEEIGVKVRTKKVEEKK